MLCLSKRQEEPKGRLKQAAMTKSDCHLLVQVTDISTFTDDKKRAEVDAWLYETCTQCLQHIIDITVKFYPVVQPLLGRVLELLLNFIRSDMNAMHP